MDIWRGDPLNRSLSMAIYRTDNQISLMPGIIISLHIHTWHHHLPVLRVDHRSPASSTDIAMANGPHEHEDTRSTNQRLTLCMVAIITPAVFQLL
jgi:hypothetical protein